MVVKVTLWYELWTSLMDLCWIIFPFSDLITEDALIVLHTDEMEEASNKRNALASLMKDVVFKILSHLPARSLFCCKCVCRSCKRLILDSNNHKNLTQTVAGFFYDSENSNRHFTSIPSVCPLLGILAL